LTEYQISGSSYTFHTYASATTSYCVNTTYDYLVNCGAGLANCDQAGSNCEVTLATDANNCGSCGYVCANVASTDTDGGDVPYTAGTVTDYIASCSGSACGSTPYADHCAGTNNNDTHEQYNSGTTYGEHIYTNGTSAYCASNRIYDCAAGTANCNSNPSDVCEINTTNDNNNCGSCGNVCGGGTTCISSVCTSTGITISGNAYDDEATTKWSKCDGSTLNISLVVNGGAASTTSCNASTGAYSFTLVTVAANNPVSVFFNTAGSNTEKGVAVTVAADSSSSITLNPRKNIVWVKTEGAVANITNTNLDHCDSVSPADCANIPYSVTTGALTVADGAELHIESSKTFAPGGTVTTSVSGTPADLDGDIHIAGIFSVGTNAVSVGGDWNNAGTFTKTTGQATTFTATAATFTITDGGSNFDTLVFNGTNGRWSFADSTVIDVDLTMTAGTLAGTNDITINGGDVTGDGGISLTGGTFLLDGAGNFGGATGWTFYNLTFGNGSDITTSTMTGANSIAVSNDMSVATSQTLSGSKSFTVSGGDVTGDGTITLTGGTFLLDGAGNFGGATGWTFYNLTFGNGVDVTKTTKTGSGAIVVSNVLTIAASQELDASDDTWTLSGTTGTPFVKTGTFTHSTSTVDYTGANAGGNTNVVATDYWNLTLTASDTFDAAGSIEASNVFTIGGSATFDAKATTVTLSGTTGTPFVKTGTFTGSSSTFIYSGNNGGGNTTIAASANYGNLQINNGSEIYVLGGTTTLAGDFTATAGTLSEDTDSLTVNGGDITGDGTITFTGGTVLLDGAGNFGGATGWTFYNLTFGNGVDVTKTTKTGSGAIVVSNVLTIAASYRHALCYYWYFYRLHFYLYLFRGLWFWKHYHCCLTQLLQFTN
jgi:hypothetical protein